MSEDLSGIHWTLFQPIITHIITIFLIINRRIYRKWEGYCVQFIGETHELDTFRDVYTVKTTPWKRYANCYPTGAGQSYTPILLQFLLMPIIDICYWQFKIFAPSYVCRQEMAQYKMFRITFQTLSTPSPSCTYR